MKERPILFRGDMVRAILEGRKTQTRRLKQKGDVGDLLWVKEAFTTSISGGGEVIYKATAKGKYPIGGGMYIGPEALQWKPSIFMPRRLSRITLRLLGVAQQFLGEIIQESAIAEGFSGVGPFINAWDDINPKHPATTNPVVWVHQFEVVR